MTDFTDYQNAVANKVRILRLPDVMERVGLRRASIYSHMAQGSFPKPIALGARARGWLESEIDTWIAVRIAAREVCMSNNKVAPTLAVTASKNTADA